MYNEDEQCEELPRTPTEQENNQLEWDNSFEEPALTHNWTGFESQAVGLRYSTRENSEGLLGIVPSIIDTSIENLDSIIQGAGEAAKEVEFIDNTLSYLNENRWTTVIPGEFAISKRLSIVSVSDRVARIEGRPINTNMSANNSQVNSPSHDNGAASGADSSTEYEAPEIPLLNAQASAQDSIRPKTMTMVQRIKTILMSVTEEAEGNLNFIFNTMDKYKDVALKHPVKYTYDRGECTILLDIMEQQVNDVESMINKQAIEENDINYLTAIVGLKRRLNVLKTKMLIARKRIVITDERPSDGQMQTIFESELSKLPALANRPMKNSTYGLVIDTEQETIENEEQQIETDDGSQAGIRVYGSSEMPPVVEASGQTAQPPQSQVTEAQVHQSQNGVNRQDTVPAKSKFQPTSTNPFQTLVDKRAQIQVPEYRQVVPPRTILPDIQQPYATANNQLPIPLQDYYQQYRQQQVQQSHTPIVEQIKMDCEQTPTNIHPLNESQAPQFRIPVQQYEPVTHWDSNGRQIPMSEKERQMEEYMKMLINNYNALQTRNDQLENMISAGAMGTTRRIYAKAEALKLPHFAGDRAAYAAWKLNFEKIIDKTDIPDNFKGTYLYASLEGAAKEYVGATDKWMDKYTELWAKLDSRYANRWTLAAEVIKNSVMSAAPTGNVKDLTEYVDEQINYIDSLGQLKMSAQQLATNALLLKLPEEYAAAIRNGLRLKRQGLGQEDYRFTPEEFRDVINDTVMTWDTTAPKKAAATTVSQTSARGAPEVQNKRIEVQSTHDIRTSNGAREGPRGRGNFHNNRGRGNFHNNRGRGGARQPQKVFKPTCQVCKDPTHFTYRCPTYTTARSKREKLLQDGSCQNCARKQHQGRCILKGSCYTCGGWHMPHLCTKEVKPTTET